MLQVSAEVVAEERTHGEWIVHDLLSCMQTLFRLFFHNAFITLSNLKTSALFRYSLGLTFVLSCSRRLATHRRAIVDAMFPAVRLVH